MSEKLKELKIGILFKRTIADEKQMLYVTKWMYQTVELKVTNPDTFITILRNQKHSKKDQIKSLMIHKKFGTDYLTYSLVLEPNSLKREGIDAKFGKPVVIEDTEKLQQLLKTSLIFGSEDFTKAIV